MTVQITAWNDENPSSPGQGNATGFRTPLLARLAVLGALALHAIDDYIATPAAAVPAPTPPPTPTNPTIRTDGIPEATLIGFVDDSGYSARAGVSTPEAWSSNVARAANELGFPVIGQGVRLSVQRAPTAYEVGDFLKDAWRGYADTGDGTFVELPATTAECEAIRAAIVAHFSAGNS